MKTHNAHSPHVREWAPATTAVVRRDAAKPIINLSSASCTEIELARRHDGVVVGKYVRTASGHVILRKVVSPEAHQLRRPAAWAVAQAHYQRLRELGGAGVELLSRDGRRWWAPAEAFERHALRITRDIDTQLALPLAHWRHEAPDARQLTFDDLLAPVGAAAKAGAGGAA